ncbi:MAG: hypothetical protein WKF96_00995 [Solirubrobacteraceae bacterium]
MHPARRRALRELGAFARQMSDHWSALSERLDPEGLKKAGSGAKPLADGAAVADEILAAVRPLASARDLEIGPAALGAGRVARARPPVPDAALEYNQALRFALLDAEHLLILIDYVGALSATEGDPELAEACAEWKASLQKPARAARRAAIGLGKTPDLAVEPLSKGHKIGYLLGWLGEATDRRRAGR